MGVREIVYSLSIGLALAGLMGMAAALVFFLAAVFGLA